MDEITFLGAYKTMRNASAKIKEIHADPDYRKRQKILDSLYQQKDQAIETMEHLMYQDVQDGDWDDYDDDDEQDANDW